MRALVSQACGRAFEGLDSLTYRSFCLYVINGMAVEETARQLGIDRSATVYQHKSRVLRAVRDAMCDILRDLDDAELLTAAQSLRSNEVIRLLADFVSGNPDVRLTVYAEPHALDRIASARRALELCGTGDDNVSRLVLPAESCVFLLEGDETSLGSRDADILLEAEGVSGLQCTLSRAGTGWTVTDQTSRNGIRINGRQTRSAELADGDVLTLGSCDLVYLNPVLDGENEKNEKKAQTVREM